MLKLVAALLSLPATLLAVVAGTGVLVVDVREADGPHIILPVPLLLAQAAASFAPREQARIDAGELRESLPAARELLRALSRAEDGELLRVEEPGEQVVISKAGDTLRVRIHGRGEDVAADVPLAMAEAILRDAEGGVAAADVVAALRQARLTDLVEVRDGHSQVKVSVW